MFGAVACNASWDYLAAFAGYLRNSLNVLIVDLLLLQRNRTKTSRTSGTASAYTAAQACRSRRLIYYHRSCWVKPFVSNFLLKWDLGVLIALIKIKEVHGEVIFSIAEAFFLNALAEIHITVETT